MNITIDNLVSVIKDVISINQIDINIEDFEKLIYNYKNYEIEFSDQWKIILKTIESIKQVPESKIYY